MARSPPSPPPERALLAILARRQPTLREVLQGCRAVHSSSQHRPGNGCCHPLAFPYDETATVLLQRVSRGGHILAPQEQQSRYNWALPAVDIIGDLLSLELLLHNPGLSHVLSSLFKSYTRKLCEVTSRTFTFSIINK